MVTIGITDARDQVQAKTANLLALMNFMSLACSVFSVVIVGLVSDRYGRLPAMALVLLGHSLNLAITAFVVLSHSSVYVLVAASLAYGIVGGGIISLIIQVSVCFADLTRTTEKPDEWNKGLTTRPDEQNRSERHRLILLGLFDAVSVFAGAVGSGVMGAVIEHCGFVVSTLGLFGLFCVPVVVIWFIPETRYLHPPIITTSPSQSTSRVIEDSSSQLINTATSPSVMQPALPQVSSGVVSLFTLIKANHPATMLICTGVFLYSIVILTESQYLFLYLMSKPFSWTAQGVGLYSGLKSLALGTASMGLTLITAWSMRPQRPTHTVQTNPPSRSASSSTVALLNADDVTGIASVQNFPMICSVPSVVSVVAIDSSRLQLLRGRLRMLIYLVFGITMVALSKIIMGFAFMLTSPACTVAAIVAPALSLFRAAVFPTLKSYLSSLHPSSSQGRLFSLIGMSEYCALLVGIPSMSAFYAATVSIFSGAVFLFSAGISLVTLAVLSPLLCSVVKELLSLERTTTVVIGT